MTRSALSTACLALSLLAGSSAGQGGGIPSGTRRSPEMLSAFRAVVATAVRSTAKVFGNGEQVALATVVAPDGFLVTKYSELKGKLTCALPDGQTVDAVIVGV